jgi:hypothetical protein
MVPRKWESFRDALLNNQKKEKVIVVNNQTTEPIKHWVSHSLIGKAKSIHRLNCINMMSKADDLKIIYVGDLHVLLSFPTPSAAEGLLREVFVWEEWFQS